MGNNFKSCIYIFMPFFLFFFIVHIPLQADNIKLCLASKANKKRHGYGQHDFKGSRKG